MSEASGAGESHLFFGAEVKAMLAAIKISGGGQVGAAEGEQRVLRRSRSTGEREREALYLEPGCPHP